MIPLKQFLASSLMASFLLNSIYWTLLSPYLNWPLSFLFSYWSTLEKIYWTFSPNYAGKNILPEHKVSIVFQIFFPVLCSLYLVLLLWDKCCLFFLILEDSRFATIALFKLFSTPRLLSSGVSFYCCCLWLSFIFFSLTRAFPAMTNSKRWHFKGFHLGFRGENISFMAHLKSKLWRALQQDDGTHTLWV